MEKLSKASLAILVTAGIALTFTDVRNHSGERDVYDLLRKRGYEVISPNDIEQKRSECRKQDKRPVILRYGNTVFAKCVDHQAPKKTNDSDDDIYYAQLHGTKRGCAE